MVPTAWQDEALARDGVSREVPCSALNPGDLPDPGIEPGSSALQADSLPNELLGKPQLAYSMNSINVLKLSK